MTPTNDTHSTNITYYTKNDNSALDPNLNHIATVFNSSTTSDRNSNINMTHKPQGSGKECIALTSYDAVTDDTINKLKNTSPRYYTPPPSQLYPIDELVNFDKTIYAN